MRRSTSVPLVARQAEVAAFRRALTQASAGRPGVLLVGGDAGVGKTRLVHHLTRLSRKEGARVVVAHCVDLGEVGIPYLPFTEALTRLRDEGSPVDAAIREHPALMRLLDPGTAAPASDDVAERLQLFDGIASCLAASGAPGAPLVLVLEDLHWAEPSTRDVLRFLVTRLRTENLLVVGTYRADDLDRRHPLRPLLAELYRLSAVERVDLRPFTEPELREFTTALAEEPLPEAEFQQVLGRSEGNAFFAEELLRSEGPSAGLPWSLADVLHARLQRLDPRVQDVARVASVAGRTVREDLLRAAASRTRNLADPAIFDTALRDAVALQVLEVEGQQLAFRHALLAEALYLDLLPGEQAAVHRAYLAALTDDPSLGTASQRAHHALHGHDLPTALAASAEAAHRAWRLLAPDEELRHREQVLSLWESVPNAEELAGEDRVAVVLAASDAASRAGLFPRAEQLARRAVEALDDDPHRQAQARDLLARYLLDLECIDAALAQAELARTQLEKEHVEGTTPSRELAWATARHARTLLNANRDAEAREAARTAVEVARAANAPGAEADALTSLAVLEVDDPAAAAELLTTARQRAAEAGELVAELRTWQNLAYTHYYVGDFEKTAEVVAAGVERARSTGLTWSAAGLQLQLLLHLVRYTQGDLSPCPAPPDTTAPALPFFTAVQQYAAVARGDHDAIARGESLRPAWERDGQIALYAGGTLVDALTLAGRHADAVALAVEVTDFLGKVWGEFFLGRIWISALALTALADTAELGTPGATPAEAAAGRAQLLAAGDTLVELAHTTARRGRPRGGKLGPEGCGWLHRADAEHARLRAAAEGIPADPALWEAALRDFEIGFRYETARSRWRWAQALHAAERAGGVVAVIPDGALILTDGQGGAAGSAVGSPSGARTTPEAEAAVALAEAEAMGAAPLTAAIREWARRARVHLPGTPPRRAEGAVTLTDREEEVLALVAEGLSNRQIGERLFISTKTVSVHVSNVLAKLGVSGRAEAVDVAHRRGLLVP